MHPAALIYYVGFELPKPADSYFAHNLIDKAQRHQYWMFEVGRSMFDVHRLISPINLAASLPAAALPALRSL